MKFHKLHHDQPVVLNGKHARVFTAAGYARKYNEDEREATAKADKPGGGGSAWIMLSAVVVSLARAGMAEWQNAREVASGDLVEVDGVMYAVVPGTYTNGHCQLARVPFLSFRPRVGSNVPLLLETR